MKEKIETLCAKDPEQAVLILTDLFEQQYEKGEPISTNLLGNDAFQLFKESLVSIESLFKKALVENDYITARRLAASSSSIVHYASLYKELVELVPSEFSRLGSSDTKVRLALIFAEEIFKKSGYVAAKASIANMLNADSALVAAISEQKATSIHDGIVSSKLPKDYFEVWELRAKENFDTSAEDWFHSLANGEGLKSSIARSATEGWINDAVSSVVTIYIDRGFKIESGFSVPDRVLGTAFQISKSLYLTNYHVIQSEVDPTYKGYSRISIRPSENPQIKVPAKVIGWDEEMDLALIQSEENAKISIFIPPAVKFQAGDRIFAVGSPIGLENSVTSGVVSSLSRKIITYGEAAQIDVPVNQGNSGSPLFSADGDLVGMVFAGLPSYQNINFALPVQWINASLPGLFEGKAATHARLGLLLGKGSGQNPMILADLSSNYPAFQAGDELTLLNGFSMKDIASIQLQLSAIPKDALCFVQAERNYKSMRRLRSLQLSDGASLIPAWDKIQRNILLEALMGAKLQHLENSAKVGGLYSVSWACPAEAADEIGLSENDIVKVVKFQLDRKGKIFILELSAKSRKSGYFERTIHLEFPAESATII